MSDATYTAFDGDHHLVTAPLPEVLRTLKARRDEGAHDVLVFDDRTGRQIDFDLRGDMDDVLARNASPSETPAKRGPGRPKLGVTAREVTPLPRQWEWLDTQRGGASATLRRLVDEARKSDDGRHETRRAAEATDRFLMVLAGDRPHFEEITRALYAGNFARFDELLTAYPPDVRTHALRLAKVAFARPAEQEGQDS